MIATVKMKYLGPVNSMVEIILMIEITAKVKRKVVIAPQDRRRDNDKSGCKHKRRHPSQTGRMKHDSRDFCY